MCESITLSLPRTKCENVRVLFSRVRLLFGVSVDPENQDQDPSEIENTTECLQFKLSVINGSIEKLNRARDYLVAGCLGAEEEVRRTGWGAEAMGRLQGARDEAERASGALVRIDTDGAVTVSGAERGVAAALRFLEECVQGDLSAHGTQSREVFRGRTLESEDSSYDSDCEAAPEPPPHDDVSRTVSETLGAEFAEYVNARPPLPPDYASRLEFALKLGYTETQVQLALQKLGPQPSQNELLAELIKLGANAASTPITPTLTTDAGDDERAQPDDLRHIVIDGSNVAMSHGNKECFSCRGIQICVDWFRARGHRHITVFVPRWRKENSRPDAPIKDQEILAQLERERLLVFTPSRHVGGRRLVCYDDRYVLRLAADSDGVVVSNDTYRDLAHESAEFKRVVEDRLLMYSFVNDRFMPPEDPLGRHGPSLDAFLRKSPIGGISSSSLPPSCPYGKKCTYGNKCKYHHPERGNQPQKSVTERLAEQAKIPLQEVKSRGLKSRESSPGDKLKSTTGQLSGTTKSKKQPLARTKSLVPSSMLTEELPEKSNVVERTKSESSSLKPEEISIKSSNPCYSIPATGYPQWTPTVPPPHISMSTKSPSWASLPATLPPSIQGAEMFLEPDGGGHLFVAKRLSDPDNKQMKSYSKQPASHPAPEMADLHRKLQRQLTLNPAYDPRLVQLGGYVDRSRQVISSPDVPTYTLQHEQPDVIPRSSSQENMHMLNPDSMHVLQHPHISHQPLSRMGSDSRVASSVHVAAPHIWDSEHQTVTRIASAPDSYHQWPPSARMQHLNSASDTRLNLFPDPQLHPLQMGFSSDLHQAWLSHGHRTIEPPRPISTMWQDPLPGIARGSSPVLSQPVRPSSVPPQTMHSGLLTTHQTRSASPDTPENVRYKVYYHLSSLFPKEQVQTVMDLYPQETNPQKICAAILTMFPKTE